MRRQQALQGALLAVVLVGGVLLGLLGMHVLDTHGTPGAHGVAHAPPAAAAAPPASSAALPLAAAPAAIPLAAAHAASPVAAVAVAPPAPPSADPGSPSGDGGAACVLALLGGILLLLRRRVAAWGALPARPSVPRLGGRAPRARPPSLVVLCISRT